METKIICPKCGSDQITADQKGFSGGKAVAGALLTGGIGLLAGTIGSKDVIITCLACGKQWKPGEVKATVIRNEDELNEVDREVIRIYVSGQYLNAVKYYKDVQKIGLKEAKDYVDNLAIKHNIQNVKPTNSKGCLGIVLIPILIAIAAYLFH